MLFQKEKEGLVASKFQFHQIELRFLKIYNEIVSSSRLSKFWLQKVKRKLLGIVMKSWQGEGDPTLGIAFGQKNPFESP